MADSERPARGGGGFSRFILWLVIIALLAGVWWLASERNERHFRVAVEGNQLVIEKGRFFPMGTGPVAAGDKMYAPVPLPAGAKPPAEMEFADQNSLDRWLFDTLSGWARDAAQKGDTRTAAGLVDRASALPGLTGAQMSALSGLRADLAWDDALTDLANATNAVDAARRKLEQVRQGGGAHAADAASLSGKLEPIQGALKDAVKR
ncbi:MAG TPA: hypothetical protein VFL36_12220 [Myxococcales bacterium]|nr:hypothetical protein [Myxococcales bacterium]